MEIGKPPKNRVEIVHPEKFKFDNKEELGLTAEDLNSPTAEESVMLLDDVKREIATRVGYPNMRLLDQYLNDGLLFRRHFDLLEGRVHIKRYSKQGVLMEEREGCDLNAVAKALDMAYKIKGYYAPVMKRDPDEEERRQTNNIQINIKGKTDAEIDELLKIKIGN
jgi:hypothetical protein